MMEDEDYGTMQDYRGQAFLRAMRYYGLLLLIITAATVFAVCFVIAVT